MIVISNHCERTVGAEVLREMFEERKRVFVDLLKWDVPVLAGRYEVDQFDTEHAAYIIITDDAGRHCGSARLLPTDQAHILDTFFQDLCDGAPPTGPQTREITRFCLSRRLTARERLNTRNRLVTALAEYALLNEVTTYTGVAEWGWFHQILAFGWDCIPLGPVRRNGAGSLAALKISINNQTIEQLRSTGIYAPVSFHHLADRSAV